MIYENTPYNLREKMNIVSGLVLGAIMPIVIGKYAVDFFNPNDNLSGEVFNWGFSLAANCITILDCKFPIPVYTGIIGTIIGKFEAERMKENRLKQKNRLDDIL